MQVHRHIHTYRSDGHAGTPTHTVLTNMQVHILQNTDRQVHRYIVLTDLQARI